MVRSDKVLDRLLQLLRLLRVTVFYRGLKLFLSSKFTDWNAFSCRDFQKITWYLNLEEKNGDKVDFYDHLSIAQVRSKLF